MSASQTSNGGKQCRKHDGHMAFLFHVLLWLLSSYHSTRSNVSVCCYFSSLRWSGGFLYVINLLAFFEVRFHCTLSHFALINIPIFQPKPSIKAFGDIFNILFCIFFMCNMKTYIKPPLYAFSSCFFSPSTFTVHVKPKVACDKFIHPSLCCWFFFICEMTIWGRCRQDGWRECWCSKKYISTLESTGVRLMIQNSQRSAQGYMHLCNVYETHM